MNPRILELAEQAEMAANKGDHVDVKIMMEKFAELIVQECAQFIFVLDAEPVSHKSAARMLQEHFGVK